MNKTKGTALPFDIREIPFSYRGSWLNLSPVVALHTTSDQLHLVSHQTGMHAVLRFEPQSNGAVVTASWHATPSEVSWVADEGQATAAFESVDTLRVVGSGLELRIADATAKLTPFTGTYFFADPVDGAAIFTSYETGRRYRVTALRGALRFEGDSALGASSRAVIAHSKDGEDGWEVAIEEFESAREPYAQTLDFEAVRASAGKAFASFARSIAPAAEAPAAELASYVLWSATVAPRGFLGRESILMSKHWMDKVWSWDHCFNAIAVAPGEGALAIDQLLAPFDHQDSAGAMPDSVTHSEVLYNFVKPPIHGWALGKVRERTEVGREDLVMLYDRLSRWSRFWLDSRRVPGHALPFYQHGNDSGWDNSTAFDGDRLVESPDLAAFLVLQFDALATLADELGTGDAEGWRTERDAMRDALVAELWDGEFFSARGATSGRASTTTSLLTLLPIIAGEHLPPEIQQKLAARIELHLTEHGLATELPSSAEYEADGYWRGPIWAPSTVLIEDGLRRTGHTELADRVRERFLALCERSGFAENFDAMSGAGLRDRAYTWTASAYLYFARG